MEYKDTIFLPKTSFEMRANLPLKEPKILEEWDKQKIFKQLREKSKGREKFVLHDGPPYANGHIHMGTALNKILKDVIVRTQQMIGKGLDLCAWLGLSRTCLLSGKLKKSIEKMDAIKMMFQLFNSDKNAVSLLKSG